MVPLNLKLPESFFQEEERAGYRVSREMKQLWAVCLDLLQELMRVCDAHGIEYFVFHGTLLGAVRHGGFIPWDDDVDVVMTRENYRKLCEIGPSEFRDPYFFQTEYTDIGFSRVLARLRNSRTTAILKSEDSRGYIHYNQGVFIDIFPLDNMPDDPEELTAWTKKLDGLIDSAFRYSGRAARCYLPEERSRRRSWDRRARRWLSCRLRRLRSELFHIYNPYVMEYERVAQLYDGQETRCMGDTHLFHESGKCVYPRELFSESVRIPFECLQVPVPKEYEKALEIRYGKNWRTPIRVDCIDRKILSLDIPYKKYNRLARRGKVE